MSGGGFGGGTPSGGGGGGGGGGKGLLGSIGDLLGGPGQGVLQLIQGAKTGDIGDILRGSGILIGTGAGALLGGPMGAAAGGRLAEAITDRTDGGQRLDPVQTLGLPQFGGIGGLAEHIGAGMATDPMMYLTGGLSEAAQAGDEAAQGVGDAAQQGLRLRVPILSKRLEAAGIPASLSAPQGLVDAGAGMRESALNAIPNLSGGSLADSIAGAKQAIATAIHPQAYRAGLLAAQDMDPALAAKGGVVDTGFAQAKAATSNMVGDFDAQAAAIQKTGGDLQGFLQQSADKVGLSLDGSDGLSLDDVRSGVSKAASDAGKQVLSSYLEAHGVPSQLVQQSVGDMPGVTDMSALEDASRLVPHPPKVQLPGEAAPITPTTPLTDAQRSALAASPYTHIPDDAARQAFLQSVRDTPYNFGNPAPPAGSLQDVLDARRAGGGFNGSGTAGAPDNFDRVNSMTGQDLTRANPAHSAIMDMFDNRTSLATGTVNRLYRQFNLAGPLSQLKFAGGDIVRNALDSGISGIGDVGKAASLQWALHSIPDEAIAAKGLEAAAQDALTPEQFQLWTQARQQGVLSSGYQADTSARGLLGRAAAPLRAEGDNARLANFSNRIGQGASPEEAAAGARGTQYDLSDITPTVAAVRRLAMPGANFMAHNLDAVLPAVAENPALAAGVIDTEHAAKTDPNAPSWVTSILTGKQFETPLQSALLGNNPVSGAAQIAGGDVKGGMATLGALPSGPTPVGALTDLYKASQHKGSTESAISEVLKGIVPGYRVAEPALMEAQPSAIGGQQDPLGAIQTILSGSSPTPSPQSSTGGSSIRATLARSGIHLPTLPTAKSIAKR